MRRHRAFGYCDACYRRLRAHGTILVPERTWGPRGAPACAQCGSGERSHRAHGLCERCYWRCYYGSAGGKSAARRAAQRYLSTARGKMGRRECARRRRERKAQVFDVVPTGYETLVLDGFEHRCARCGAQKELELDHHRPLIDGHPLLHNAVALCVPCNRAKHVSAPERFYTRWQLAEVLLRLVQVRDAFVERFVESATAETNASDQNEC